MPNELAVRVFQIEHLTSPQSAVDRGGSSMPWETMVKPPTNISIANHTIKGHREIFLRWYLFFGEWLSDEMIPVSNAPILATRQIPATKRRNWPFFSLK